jgi:AmiR/NasT family two-component response regulator
LQLATISSQPDIEMVGRAHDDTEIAGAVEQIRPDFLIVTLDEADRCTHAATYWSITRILR